MILGEHKTRSRREVITPSVSARTERPATTGRSSQILVNAQHTHYPVIERVSKRLRWAVYSKRDDHPVEDGAGTGEWPVERPLPRRDQGDWSVMWADSGLNAEKYLRTCRPFQRVNHFPGMVQIYRKSNLARSMARMRRLSAEAYDFFPRSWVLPDAANEVLRYLSGASSPRADGLPGTEIDDTNHGSGTQARCVIVKPSGGAQGKGIYLCMHPRALRTGDDAVAQVYIARPLLLGGYKFDMRIYALITCCDPLRVLVYREGLCRLCTEPYRAPDASNVGEAYMHLTNYSVNKHNPNFIQNNSPRMTGAVTEGEETTSEQEDFSSKRSLSWLWDWLRERDVDPSEVWTDICNVVVKTLISVQAGLADTYRSCQTAAEGTTPFNAFELLGFDILLTENYRAVLIEVNHMPSFRTDSTLDKVVKEGLIENTLRLINVTTEEKERVYARSAAQSKMRLYGSLYKDEDLLGRKRKHLQQESRVKQWEAYLKNERRFVGNFDLVYPANEDPQQPTWGLQPLYASLLTAAHEDYWSSDPRPQLGTEVAVLSVDDDSATAKKNPHQRSGSHEARSSATSPRPGSRERSRSSDALRRGDTHALQQEQQQKTAHFRRRPKQLFLRPRPVQQRASIDGFMPVEVEPEREPDRRQEQVQVQGVGEGAEDDEAEEQEQPLQTGNGDLLAQAAALVSQIDRLEIRDLAPTQEQVPHRPSSAMSSPSRAPPDSDDEDTYDAYADAVVAALLQAPTSPNFSPSRDPVIKSPARPTHGVALASPWASPQRAPPNVSSNLLLPSPPHGLRSSGLGTQLSPDRSAYHSSHAHRQLTPSVSVPPSEASEAPSITAEEVHDIKYDANAQQEGVQAPWLPAISATVVTDIPTVVDSMRVDSFSRKVTPLIFAAERTGLPWAKAIGSALVPLEASANLTHTSNAGNLIHSNTYDKNVQNGIATENAHKAIKPSNSVIIAGADELERLRQQYTAYRTKWLSSYRSAAAGTALSSETDVQ